MINDRDGSKERPDAYAIESTPSSGHNAVPKSSPSLARKPAAAGSDRKDAPGLIAAAAHAAVPTWANMILMVSLIFGGCCANVSVWLHPGEERTDIGRRYSLLRRSSSKSIHDNRHDALKLIN